MSSHDEKSKWRLSEHGNVRNPSAGGILEFELCKINFVGQLR